MNTTGLYRVMLLASEVVRCANFSTTDIKISLKASQSNLTVLSSRNNALLSVYDVSRNQGGLLQSHTSPYCLPARFPSGPHAGFYVLCPHPESGNATTTSLLQLSSRGGIYQTSLVVCQDKIEKHSPAPIDISWSPAVRRLAATPHIQRPDVGQLGARAMQEVDFRQAYQRISFLALCSRIAQKLCTPLPRTLFSS